jgi:hypothetical protein
MAEYYSLENELHKCTYQVTEGLRPVLTSVITFSLLLFTIL